MTQYQRFTGKVFGGNATATGNDPQIAQFGSALANTFVGTTDPATIQQLPAWGQGWIGAVTPDSQFPPLPEMTGAMKVLSHQICGILQQGISTWDNGTIYYTGNFVSLNGKLYVSQVDENQGNNPETDTTNWKEFVSDSGLEGKITNCIKSAPQRIKYTLVNGTFTLLAGSVVIVPYGTEDKTAEFPIGSTFIHENFKVYDRQFADGRFFVWAEVQEDIARNVSSTSVADRLVLIDLSTNAFSTYSSVTSSNTQYSGTGSNNNYRTDLNVIQFTQTGTLTSNVASFPICVATSSTTYLYDSLKSVFQYTGFIGLTVWTEKGINGLTANGKNSVNGTLINEEWETNKVELREIPNANSTRIIALNPNRPLSDVAIGSILLNYFEYIEQENRNYDLYPEGVPYEWKYTPIATVVILDGKITDFISRPILNILSYSNKSEISSWVAPSDVATYFTVGASGAKYTAPANGWFYFSATFSNNGNNFVLLAIQQDDSLRKLVDINRTQYSGIATSSLFVRKGDTVVIEYSNTTTSTKNLKFVYAEGEV